MKDLEKICNPFCDDKAIDACSIFGMMDTSGKCFSGKEIIRAIGNMHVRGNGLGGGFAVYGLYPDYADCYAFHIMYLCPAAKENTECFLRQKFHFFQDEQIPVQQTPGIVDPPLLWRYFLKVNQKENEGRSEDDYVVDCVMKINTQVKDSFVFSSGKNMAVFKGVGYPEEIGEYFCLDKYSGYLWTAHGRFPTNTRGWWGGAHPFNILDWTVVHNGEISSYGINRRYLEQYGYNCTMQTDTEVLTYAVDLLVRKHGLPLAMVSKVFAPPFWDRLTRLPQDEQDLIIALRLAYSSLLMNGPFTIIVAHEGEMMGLTDRIRLRPLTVGIKNQTLYLSSEESAIRLICPELDDSWIPRGGEPIIGSLKAPISPLKRNSIRSTVRSL